MTKTLWQKLHEIAADQGNHDPDGRYFENMLKLSSGRITQIKQGGTSIGPKAIAELVAKGYNPKWLSGESKDKWLQKEERRAEQQLPANVAELKRTIDHDPPIAKMIELMRGETDEEVKWAMLAAARKAIEEYRRLTASDRKAAEVSKKGARGK